MTTTTQINITAKDQTGQAFASANNNLTSLASSAAKTAAGLAGIGLSIAGAVESIRGISQATIQFQQFTSTLQVGTGSAKAAADSLAFVRSESQRLGLDLATAAEQFAKLTAASKGSALEGKATRDIFSSMSEAATVLGLSADQTRGALNAFQQMISKGKVQAEELRGQLGERLPGAFQMAARAMGVTTAELDKLLVAGKVTAEDLLPKLSIELNRTFGPQAEKSAQNLSAQINRMNTAIFDLKIAIGESGLINFLSSGIELATKLASALTSAFGGGQKLSPVEKQLSLIQKLEEELTHIQALNSVIPFSDSAFSNFIFSKKDQDELRFRIESAKEDLEKLKEAALIPVPGSKPTVPGKVTTDAKGAKDALRELNKAQDFALARESEYIKLLTIERKAREDLIKPYLDSAKAEKDRLSMLDLESEALSFAIKNEISLKHAIELTTIARLEEKKAITRDTTAIDAINREITSRREIIGVMQQIDDKTKQLERSTHKSTDEMSQLWMQAGRNIQSTLANSIFNFFDDGLKGMLKNVTATVGRIASEFAALRIAQSIGLAGMFGAGSASASTGAAGGGGLMGMASSMFSTGFGATSLMSGVGGMLPGSAGAFFGGMGGGTIAGVSSPAALMGSSFAAAAGPAIGIALAAYAVDAMGNAFAGDKTIGGKFGATMQKIPVLGTGWDILAGLFGREPYKFRQQSLQGAASSEGFEGDISTVFRAKGGVFRSNGHKSVTEQLSLEMQTMFDQTINGFYDSASSFAENLGLSADLVDSFTAQVQIKSEKGKTLTEEAIAEMLDGIGNSLARNVLPIVDTLRKAGEDSFATLARLNTEFVTLTQAAQNLGASADYAKELVSSLAINTRTAYVDAAGGPEELLALTAKFNQNFLTEAERMAPIIKFVEDGLDGLGISATISKDAFGDLIQTLMQSASDADKATALLLLRNQDVFLSVNSYKESMQTAVSGSADLVGDAFSALRRSVDAERKRVTNEYNDDLASINISIQNVTGNVQKLTALNDTLKSTLDVVNPISSGNAREQIRAAIEASMNGDIINVDEISAALNKLSESDKTGFSNRNDFLRNKAENSSLISTLQDAAEDQLSIEERSLNTLIDNKTQLEKGFDNEIQRLDALVTAAQQEIDVMEGLDTTIKTLAEAIGGFNRATVAAGGSPINGSSVVRGNESISSKDIVHFANTHSPMETYKAAIQYGVSSDQIVASGKYTRAEVEQFVKDNKLASFDVGGIVPKTGLALIHKNEQILNSSQKDAITDALERLIVAVNSGARSSADVFKMLRDMSIDGTSLRTTAA